MVCALGSEPVEQLDAGVHRARMRDVLARDTAGFYLRQVDIPGVDTMFIGRHRGGPAELLDLVLPSGRVTATGDGFE